MVKITMKPTLNPPCPSTNQRYRLGQVSGVPPGVGRWGAGACATEEGDPPRLRALGHGKEKLQREGEKTIGKNHGKKTMGKKYGKKPWGKNHGKTMEKNHRKKYGKNMENIWKKIWEKTMGKIWKGKNLIFLAFDIFVFRILCGFMVF